MRAASRTRSRRASLRGRSTSRPAGSSPGSRRTPTSRRTRTSRSIRPTRPGRSRRPLPCWPGRACSAPASTRASSPRRAPDLDVFLFREGPGPDPIFMGQAADGDSNEMVNVNNPPADTYTVFVHGFATNGPSADFTLFEWQVPTTSAGNMNVPGARRDDDRRHGAGQPDVQQSGRGHVVPRPGPLPRRCDDRRYDGRQREVTEARFELRGAGESRPLVVAGRYGDRTPTGAQASTSG